MTKTEMDFAHENIKSVNRYLEAIKADPQAKPPVLKNYKEETAMTSKENYCLFCQKRFPKVEWLKPLYSWTDGEMEGYFCEQHYH
ncbi:hypothetical protein [Peribacillus simplex]|uniref:hypothetical protein n=1 Tax=Peribacillus simplex TaxID=1478 RepID=UPI00366B0759